MSEDAKLDEFVEKDRSEDSEFVDTAAGRIPSDWDTESVESLCELRNGKATDHVDLGEKQYLVFGSNGPIGSHSESNFDRGLIFGRVGAVGEVERIHEPVWVSDNAIQATVNDSCNTDYLYYYLSNKELSSLATKTAQPLLNQSTIGNVTVPSPPLPEQRKIATVLYTVDQAIEKAERIINHNEKLKRGIRQDIFQHGGLSSEITTAQRIGPKEYEMPEDWEVTNLSQVAEIKGGQGFKSSNYVDEGVPLIKISNVQNGYLDLQDPSYLPEEYLNEYSEAALSEGDVVLVLTRPIIGDGIKAARIDRNDNFLLNQRLAVIDPKDEGTILREYLYHLIFTTVFIDQVKATVRATHQPNLSKTDLKNFSIPVPDINQQQRICELLGSVDDVVEINISYRNHLQYLKKGLMRDLLSGTVRTTDTNIEVPDEIAQHG